jgi:glycosyltransferase involved in cell wall biosynthesis
VAVADEPGLSESWARVLAGRGGLYSAAALMRRADLRLLSQHPGLGSFARWQSRLRLPRVVLNGRFLSAPQTGVQRAASELIVAIDALIPTTPALRSSHFELAVPASTASNLNLESIKQRPVGCLGGNLWEQIELPQFAAGALLVNLCNTAPIIYRNSIVMIHDAQVYEAPASYGKMFRLWYKMLLPAIARRARAVVTVSEFSRHKLGAYGVIDPATAIVVYNGCEHIARTDTDLEILRRLDLLSVPFIVAFSSTQSHKNLSVLLEAFADPLLSSTKLVLVGSASESRLREAGMNPPSNAVFTGKISDGQLRALLEQANALAFPSLTEGFGLPPLEAMTLGCPTIVSPRGALPEVCGDAALYADPSCPNAWVAQVCSLGADPALRDKLRLMGLARSRQYTWRRAAEDLISVIFPRAD